ncbi:MAG: hypothetical protein AABZ60_19790 [Planctomycetota bacterium]
MALSQFENFQQTYSDFVQTIQAKTVKGSYRNPTHLLKSTGQAITHTRFFITTQNKSSIKLIRSEKKQDDQLKLLFHIGEYRGGKATNATSKRTNQIEIVSSDFDESPSAPLQKLLHQNEIQAQMKKLEGLPPDQFVTLIYPVQYASPENLFNMVRNKASVLGNLVLNSDNATILINDRVEYTRNLVLTLLALDQRIPQVIIELKILEVSAFDSSEIGVDFAYLKQTHNEALQLNYQQKVLPSYQTNLSGVFSDLDSGTLQKFLGDIQLLAQKSKVDILANSTLVVLHNRRAVFTSNQGNPIYTLPNVNEYQIQRSNQDQRTSDHDSRNLVRREQYIAEETKSFDETNFNHTIDMNQGYLNNQEFSKNQTHSREIYNTGVNISITPQVRNSSEVILSVQPSYSEIVGYHKESGTPVVATRNVNTEVRLKHGETIIIGGLFRKKTLKQESGIPVLKDIPLMGALFSSEISIQERNEIVFMLTCFIQY